MVKGAIMILFLSDLELDQIEELLPDFDYELVDVLTHLQIDIHPTRAAKLLFAGNGFPWRGRAYPSLCTMADPHDDVMTIHGKWHSPDTILHKLESQYL